LVRFCSNNSVQEKLSHFFLLKYHFLNIRIGSAFIQKLTSKKKNNLILYFANQNESSYEKKTENLNTEIHRKNRQLKLHSSKEEETTITITISKI